MSILNDLLSVTTAVTKEWAKQRKAEERGRSRHSREYVYSDRVHFTDVADAILPDGYAYASGGRYSVSKRQLYYAVREQFKEKTGRELEWNYFAGTLLVQYRNRHPEAEEWKITADPRGTLTIPNCGHENRIPCGTILIDRYLNQAAKSPDAFDIDAYVQTEWPSVAAGQRYQAVLYIEKEGFEPVLQEARIAERFDLAILSCKGQSVVAARKLVDEVCRVDGGVPLFVVHDFDKAGFEISQRLTTVSDWAEEFDRVTYRFKNTINVVDLGLRLDDVRQYNLAHETCRFRGHFASDLICTAEEQEYLRSGRRVELNAFTSPQFVEWLEAKLTAHLPGGRMIPANDVLALAYRRAVALARLNAAIEEIQEEAVEEAESLKIPKGLRRRLRKAMKTADGPWDEVLYRMAEEAVE
jgi:hypothetical protein